MPVSCAVSGLANSDCRCIIIRMPAAADFFAAMAASRDSIWAEGWNMGSASFREGSGHRAGPRITPRDALPGCGTRLARSRKGCFGRG